MRVKQTHHRNILAALRTRDGATASHLMQAHLRETVNELLPVLPADAKPGRAAA
jgi:DNA-binding GntR family transcriptional regulator